MGIAPSSMQCVRSRAAGAVRSKSGRCVTSSIAIGLTYNADRAVEAGIKCAKQSLVFWHVAGEFVRTRVRRAWTSLEQLCDGSSRWIKVRGFWFPLHRTSWKQAGGEGVYWSLTGVGYSAELIQVLSRDILSVHWALAATHWDGAGLERGCDVSIIKQHLRFFETRENHAMYGALLSAATGGCWPKAHVARLLHVEQDESCVRCGAVLDDSSHQKWSCPVINAIPHDDVRKSQHLFQRAKCEKNSSPCFWTRGLVPAEWMEVPVGCGRTTRKAQFL